MLTISRDKVYDRLDKNIPPSAICESGETVIFETRDCYDDSVTSEERPLGDREDAWEIRQPDPCILTARMRGMC